MALNKPLEAIEEGDLQTLIDNQVSEQKTIEYKEALPGNSDGDKAEVIKPAFDTIANAAFNEL